MKLRVKSQNNDAQANNKGTGLFSHSKSYTDAAEKAAALVRERELAEGFQEKGVELASLGLTNEFGKRYGPGAEVGLGYGGILNPEEHAAAVAQRKTAGGKEVKWGDLVNERGPFGRAGPSGVHMLVSAEERRIIQSLEERQRRARLEKVQQASSASPTKDAATADAQSAPVNNEQAPQEEIAEEFGTGSAQFVDSTAPGVSDKGMGEGDTEDLTTEVLETMGPGWMDMFDHEDVEEPKEVVKQILHMKRVAEEREIEAAWDEERVVVDARRRSVFNACFDKRS